MKKTVALSAALLAAAGLTALKAEAWFKKTHINIVEEALKILSQDGKKQAVKMLEPFTYQIFHGATVPDVKGDCDNGSGLHYYSPLNKFGLPNRMNSGYYPNRHGGHSKSAGTMLEENYTMALVFWQNGKYNTACVLLGRALHFLSDICCVPHTTSRVCTGNPKNCHMAFEQEANRLVGKYNAETASDLYGIYEGLSAMDIANALAEASSEEYEGLVSKNKSEFEAIAKRTIPLAQKAAAAFLYKFTVEAHKEKILDEEDFYSIRNSGTDLYLHQDLSLSEEKEHFGITFNFDGSVCLCGENGEALMVGKKYRDVKLSLCGTDDRRFRITCHKKFGRALIDIPILKRAGAAAFKPSCDEHYWIFEPQSDE